VAAGPFVPSIDGTSPDDDLQTVAAYVADAAR
jgi:hypothetical protein